MKKNMMFKRMISIILVVIMSSAIPFGVFAKKEICEYFEGAEKIKWKFYEAEDAKISSNYYAEGVEKVEERGYSGGGYAPSYGMCGQKTTEIEFNVKANISGEQDIYIGYCQQDTVAQRQNFYINGENLGSILFPQAECKMIRIRADLKAGVNTIVMQSVGNVLMFVDFIAISKGEEWKDEVTAIKLKIGENAITKITENGEEIIQSDVSPAIKDSRTFIPVRGVFEQLGAVVKWEAKTRQVSIESANTTVVVKIDGESAFVNGKKKYLDSPAFIEDGRTFIPVRFISENLGYAVEWNGNKQEILIKYMEGNDINISVKKFEKPKVVDLGLGITLELPYLPHIVNHTWYNYSNEELIEAVRIDEIIVQRSGTDNLVVSLTGEAVYTNLLDPYIDSIPYSIYDEYGYKVSTGYLDFSKVRPGEKFRDQDDVIYDVPIRLNTHYILELGEMEW